MMLLIPKLLNLTNAKTIVNNKLFKINFQLNKKKLHCLVILFNL